MATYRAFPGYRQPQVNPAALQAYAQQQEAAKLREINAIGERNRQLQQLRAEAEDAKLKSQREAEIAKQAANFDLHRSRTNHEMNLFNARQAAKDKPKNIEIVEKVGDRTVKKSYTPEEYAKLKKSEELKKLTDERDVLANSWQMPMGMSSIPGKLKDIDAQIEKAKAAPDLLSTPNAFSSPAPVAPPVHIVGGVGVDTPFNGTTSWSGPGWAKTPSYGFIGTPGSGQNAFVGGSDSVATEQAPDLLSAPSFSSTIGDLRQAGAAPEAPVPQDAPMAPYKGAPKSHIKHLLDNPDTADDFNAKYGAGSAEALLEQDR